MVVVVGPGVPSVGPVVRPVGLGVPSVGFTVVVALLEGTMRW